MFNPTPQKQLQREINKIKKRKLVTRFTNLYINNWIDLIAP